jgi:hypothetical protein
MRAQIHNSTSIVQCIPGAYLFLLPIVLLSLVQSHVPLLKANPGLVCIPASSLPHGAKLRETAISGTFNMTVAKTHQQVIFTASAKKLAQRCWNDCVKPLVGGEGGQDTTGAGFQCGALFLGARAGLWSFDIDTGTFDPHPEGEAAFRAFTDSYRHEVHTIVLANSSIASRLWPRQHNCVFALFTCHARSFYRAWSGTSPTSWSK